MDPLTHAASGALAALSCAHRPRNPWVVPLAAMAAASPDVDVFFASSPLNFLLLHRGITHSLFAAPILGTLLALLMIPYWRGHDRSVRPDAWSFRETAIFATLLVLLHIWLDCVTTYGTLIFLPFSDYRVRLNGIFIIDLLLILPMLAALWQGRRTRHAAVLGLVWTLLYPAACVGLRLHHEAAVTERLTAQQVPARQVTVLPDTLAPFFWRVIYTTDAPFTTTSHGTVWQQGLNAFGTPRTEARAYPAADPELTGSLAAVSREGAAFFRFTLLPVQESHPINSLQEGGVYRVEYRFYDLRFNTMLPLVERMLRARPNGDRPFQLLARRESDPAGDGPRWTEVRMIFSGASRHEPWHAPDPLRQPIGWQWLVGL